MKNSTETAGIITGLLAEKGWKMNHLMASRQQDFGAFFTHECGQTMALTVTDTDNTGLAHACVELHGKTGQVDGQGTDMISACLNGFENVMFLPVPENIRSSLMLEDVFV